MAHLHHRHSQYFNFTPGHDSPPQQQQQRHAPLFLQNNLYQFMSSDYQLDVQQHHHQLQHASPLPTHQTQTLRPLQSLSQTQSLSSAGFYPVMASQHPGTLPHRPSLSRTSSDGDLILQCQRSGAAVPRSHASSPLHPRPFIEQDLQSRLAIQHQPLASLVGLPSPLQPSHQQVRQSIQQRLPPLPLRSMPALTTPAQSHQMAAPALRSPNPSLGGSSAGSRTGSVDERLGASSNGGSPGGVATTILGASPSSATRAQHAEITPGATNQVTPLKDHDGKYPCPHCTKTYLHAKHLKRHLLRHTGSRPYQCVLCKDTFSRSDILKRHFYKCSIRRGNPTGATHLSHAHAHQPGRRSNHSSQPPPPRLPPPPPPPPLPPPLLDIPVVASAADSGVGFSPETPPEAAQKGACDQCESLETPCEASEACKRCRTGGGCDCRYERAPKRSNSGCDGGVSPRGEPGTDQAVGYGDGFNFPPPTHPTAHMVHQGHQQLSNSQRRQRQQRSSQQANVSQPSGVTNYYHTPQAVDWASLISTPDAGFMGSFYMPQPLRGNEFACSADMSQVLQSPTAYHPHPYYCVTQAPGVPVLDGPEGYPPWPEIAFQVNPLQAKCDTLVALCFPESLSRASSSSGSPDQHLKSDPGDEDLKEWLTPDNVEHFVRLFFVNFQGHFPMIHAGSFDIILTADYLILAMVCIGAVYSERGIVADDVRNLMDRTFAALDRIEPRSPCDVTPSLRELEEIQARYFLHVISAWHGTLRQRETSRRNYGIVISKAKAAGLFRPFTPSNPGINGYSIYHQVEDTPPPAPGAWCWAAWVEQERRNRVMFGILLLDTAYAIFFNRPPRVHFEDIRLTLPSDDAPWEATTAEGCAIALGLGGEGLNSRNISGTRGIQQPEFMGAMNDLLLPDLEFKAGTTNPYSKFILIHVIHSHIWSTQEQLPNATEAGLDRVAESMTTQSTLWNPDNGGDGDDDDDNSEESPKIFLDAAVAAAAATLLDSDEARAVRNFHYAIEKWKKAWDTDRRRKSPARAGFGRDGLPFYWLAKLYLAKNRTADWKHGIDDDKTVAKVKNMLKHLRPLIKDATDSYGLKSAVSAIDDGFAMDELTHDMKLLFRPMNELEGGGGPPG